MPNEISRRYLFVGIEIIQLNQFLSGLTKAKSARLMLDAFQPNLKQACLT